MQCPKLSIFVSHPSHFLTDHQPHGDGLLAYAYIDQLARRGHELHVAVPLMDLQAPLRTNVHVYPVNCIAPPSASAPSLAHRMEYAVRVRRLFNRIRRHTHIDLVHQLNPVVSGMSLMLRGCGVPLVLGPIPPQWPRSAERTQHASDDQHFFKRQARRVELEMASAILVPTPASLDEFAANSKTRDRVVELNYGVDVTAFSPADDQDVVARPPAILFLANLLNRKGIFVLLRAFEEIGALVPDCQLIIAGEGPDAEAVRDHMKRSRHANRIAMLGRVSREMVPKLMRAATVYCLPSYGEPFGMTALEAMACGKPVVGTDAGGLGHLLRKANAIAVKPGDAAGLAAGLVRVLRSKSLQLEMGLAGRQLVVDEFSWDAVSERLESVYHRVLKGLQFSALMQTQPQE